jgi:multidrug efflux pump subunit AcrB
MSDKETSSAIGSKDSSLEQGNEDLGLAGKTAKFFIQSPLSPLFYMTMFLLGVAGLMLTPRQEDPQISVPMVDIFVQYPGAEAREVASLAIQPLERIMWEIQGVKHVYSATQRGSGIVTIEFDVGEQMEPSLVKVNDQLASNMDKIPPGVAHPLVKAKGVDDVPAVTITLWSDKDYNGDGIPDVDDSQLRQLAHSVLQSLKEIADTGEGFVVGGRAERVIIELVPERLAGFGISLEQVAQAVQGANAEQQIGSVETSGTQLSVVTGSFLKTVDDINRLQVGNHNGVPVYVRDVAEVRQGPEDATQLVAYYTGAASKDPERAQSVPAVTIAIAKKKGTNGVAVAEQVLERIEELKQWLIPGNVEVSITRNYGESADQKVKDLIFKLSVATSFVGILVDDAIVVVENIYRRWLEEGKTNIRTAIDAVREVGNPTILATFTVIAALLPMGFVRGMMGPYMMPIPALGSSAMFISLFAAFVFTPWLAKHPLFCPSMRYLKAAEEREHKEAEWLGSLYKRILIPLISSRPKRALFKLVLWGGLLLTFTFFYFELVAVKMLPLDNKPEFEVVLDMQEGTALAETANQANRIANRLRTFPEVTAVQIYVGTAKPFDFNGMVRHYYLRQQSWQAEIQVQLVNKKQRDRTSHEIAVDARAQLSKLLAGIDGNFSVVEMPPGPPVLQSVVADVHGPDSKTRIQVARDLTEIFKGSESLRDVDNLMQSEFDYWHFEVDREKSNRRGISVSKINNSLAMAMGGMVLGDVKQRAGHEPVNIIIQVPLAERSNIGRLGDILVQSGSGEGVPLRELGTFNRKQEDPIIYHKDLRPVEYVTADVGGRLAAPIYGMLQVGDLLQEGPSGKPYITPDGVKLADETYWLGPPKNDNKSAIEWTGEWTVTYETFRDMGGAFIAALILIYILVVWEFGNFRIPALIMAPIPLTLIGIIPAHAFTFAMGWGGEFTATSMIGWIALAGIIVRNSILLVDFSIHQIKKGDSVQDAVIMSCQTRTRPILITAFALVCGSSVIFFDPIFQGMAISLASGVLVSTVLTLIVIPLGCVEASDSLLKVSGMVEPEPDEGTEQMTSAAETPSRPVWSKIWGALIFLAGLGIIGLKKIAQLVREKNQKRRVKKQQESRIAKESVSPVTLDVQSEIPVDEDLDVSDISKPIVKTQVSKATKKKVVLVTKKIARKRKPTTRKVSKKSTLAAASKLSRKKTAKKVVAKKKLVTKVAIGKKTQNMKRSASPRRGIRLKTLAENSDDELG